MNHLPSTERAHEPAAVTQARASDDPLALAAALGERAVDAADDIERVLAKASGFALRRVRELITAHTAARSAASGLAAIAAAGRSPSRFALESDERAVAAAERLVALAAPAT